MISNPKSWPALVIAVACLSACAPSKDQIRQVLIDNPDIIFEAIDKNPDRFIETAQKASESARRVASQRQAEEAKKQLEEELKNPKKPEIEADRAVRGPRNAQITIVEYSDFQCPFCKRGYETVEELLKKYGDKVNFVFKHLPLPFHPLAMPAAKRFEAIALQDHAKAFKFHDLVFQSQESMKDEKWLDEQAKKAGANLARMKKDLDSPKVKGRIEADMAEARKFGIEGTPGFVVGGVVVRGAYPTAHFEEIIDRKLKGVSR